MSLSPTDPYSKNVTTPPVEVISLPRENEVSVEEAKGLSWADGLEVVPREDGMEVAGADGMQRTKEDNLKEVSTEDGIEALPLQEDVKTDEESSNEHDVFKSRTKGNGRRWPKWVWYVLAAITILGVALGVGLGVGLRSSR